MTDAEALDLVQELLKTRVKLAVAYLVDEDGALTDQLIRLECGELVASSMPEPLPVPLIPSPAGPVERVLN